MEQTYTFTIQPSMLKPSGCGRLVAAPTEFTTPILFFPPSGRLSAARKLPRLSCRLNGTNLHFYHSTKHAKTFRLRAAGSRPYEGPHHPPGYSLISGVSGDFHRPYERLCHSSPLVRRAGSVIILSKNTPPQSDWLTGPFLGGRDYHMEGIYVRRNENHTGIRR